MFSFLCSVLCLSCASSFSEKTNTISVNNAINTTQNQKNNDVKKVVPIQQNNTDLVPLADISDQDTSVSIKNKIDNLDKNDPDYSDKKAYLNMVRDIKIDEETKEKDDNEQIQCNEKNQVQISNWNKLMMARKEIRSRCKSIGGGVLFPDPDAVTSHDRIVESNGYLEFREKNPFVVIMQAKFTCPSTVLKETFSVYVGDGGSPDSQSQDNSQSREEIVIRYLDVATKWMHTDPQWVGTRDCRGDRYRVK